ncbi:hypothetical protein Javan508_0020 [Streptococcus phage Javan508]|nr:hypothetical protein HMPREF1241_0824 [Streptococcus pyogenes GA03799]QBX29643.1 hypothetical protein Javan508_0020 [Streptococcus phage Javan508]
MIRYNPELFFDNTMFVEFNGRVYKIDKIESGKDITMISGVSMS